MCAERVQRVLMALVVVLGTYFVTLTSIWGLVIIGFVVVMMLIWAFTDFCPSIWILKKFLPSCYDR
ncbi:MAG: YgaP-like transmembrane domain [Campylobacterales bacterium]